jgi:uncharacterized Zn finger protein (UPF0148 family)
MNHTTCWRCKKEFEYDGEPLRDVHCPHCGVLNSIMSQDVPDWSQPNQKEESKMTEQFDYNQEKYQSKFVYLPRVGEAAEFEIKEIREVLSDNPKFNFVENVPVIANGEQLIDDEGEPVFKKKDLGYHIECILTNGRVLTVTSLTAFYQVFKKNNIQPGEKVRISHIDKGQWKVEKILDKKIK